MKFSLANLWTALRMCLAHGDEDVHDVLADGLRVREGVMRGNNVMLGS
jgi:hypothetical protein